MEILRNNNFNHFAASYSRQVLRCPIATDQIVPDQNPECFLLQTHLRFRQDGCSLSWTILDRSPCLIPDDCFKTNQLSVHGKAESA